MNDLRTMTDPTELGPARPPRKDLLPGVEARVSALSKLTVEETVAVAARVQRSANPLNAATNVSVREILALTEVVLMADARLQPAPKTVEGGPS